MLEVAPIWQPHIQQQNYRVLLEAMSRPGTVHPIQGLSRTSNSLQAVLAALLDGSVRFCDLSERLETSDIALLQAIQTVPEEADYLLCSGIDAPDFQPRLGSLASPEQSATLLVHVEALQAGDLQLDLTGPGIKQNRVCNIQGLDADWLVKRESWVCGFPMGVDLILLDQQQLMALPRTTRVEVH
ncbi:MAG: phosphonate C-P lyase system protein PhnH [Candidatus Thiodiazotropha endolucinida]|nr:phosphonate C-P lyase system protein PhnH [Candidatus Thiodiazotropha taylori]MCW4319125.1 phosphonate C-P lyase system protein PhnH [Candidatus Thiodiazotropha taylori]